MTADTAHQLKTPLAVLRARLEQLGEFDGRKELERDVQRMTRLVQQLLHFAVLSQHPASLSKGERAEQLAKLEARYAKTQLAARWPKPRFEVFDAAALSKLSK